MRGGLGSRPDGSPVTASEGIAEIRDDASRDWKAMVELADQRMYQAKTSARSRCVCADGATLLWLHPEAGQSQV
jgi:PleD family two-component response regulator